MADPNKQRRQCRECGRWYYPRDNGQMIAHAIEVDGEVVFCHGSGGEPR